MQDTTKLELRAKPKQIVRVNKPMVLVIAASVVFVVLLAVINAFNTTKIIKTNGAIKVTTEKPVIISTKLSELPGSYSDINAVQKYSAARQIDEVAKLQQQLNDLKQMNAALQQQLSTASQAGSSGVSEDPRAAQAKNSSLVFSGLGSAVENLVGTGSSSDGRLPYGSQLGGKQEDLVATQQQAKLFEKQAENTQKLAVMKAVDRPEEIYDLHNIVKPVSPYQIQAGTIIPSTLITGINTTISGTIIAQVRQNLYDTVRGKYLLIPRGSKLIGNYDSRILYGQRRIAIVFNRIIRPDGSSILIGKADGADLQGHSGVEGDVNNHWARVLGAATISTLLSIGSGVAADQMSSSDKNREYRSAQQNAVLGGASGISDVGKMMTNRALEIPPTITLPAGYLFTVLVRRDMVLTPYKA